MKTSMKKTMRLLLLVVAVAVIGLGSATSAYADDASRDPGQVSGQEMDNLKKASPQDREKVRKVGVDEATKQYCGKVQDSVVALPGQNKEQICNDEVGGQIDKVLDTPEKALQHDVSLDEICGSVTGANLANSGLKISCVKKEIKKAVGGLGVAIRQEVLKNPVVKAVAHGEIKAMEVKKFVENADDPFATLVNYAHDNAVKLTKTVLESITTSTDFNGTEGWFVDSWAAGAGVGVLLMGLMLLLSFRDAAAGRIDHEELVSGLSTWGPAVILFSVAGPKVMGTLASKTSEMSTSIVESQAGNITDRLTDFLKATADLTEKAAGLGVLAMILVFLLMLVAALMLLVVFILQKIALVMMAYGIAIMLGCLANPRWRGGVKKAATTWVMVLVSKPLLLIMLSLVFMTDFSSFGVGAGEGMRTVTQIIAVTICMAGVALAPMMLMRYVPMAPSGGAGPWAEGVPDMGSSSSAGTKTHNDEIVDRSGQRSRSSSSSGPDESSVSGKGSKPSGQSSSGSPSQAVSASNGSGQDQQVTGTPSSGSSRRGTAPAAAGSAKPGASGRGGTTASAATEASSSGGKTAAGAGKQIAGGGVKTASVAGGPVAAGTIMAAAKAKRGADAARSGLVGLNERAAGHSDDPGTGPVDGTGENR